MPSECPPSEFKRLYNKAYRNRDNETRQEDLIQRFLLGLLDYKARIHIELNREPKTIEEAVEEVVIYTETMKNPQQNEENSFKRSVRQVRNTNHMRITGNKGNDVWKPEIKTTKEGDSYGKMLYTKEELKEIFNEMFQDKKDELQVHGNSISDTSTCTTTNMTEGRNLSGTFKNTVLCYCCGQPGHIARFCYSRRNSEPNQIPTHHMQASYNAEPSHSWDNNRNFVHQSQFKPADENSQNFELN